MIWRKKIEFTIENQYCNVSWNYGWKGGKNL